MQLIGLNCVIVCVKNFFLAQLLHEQILKTHFIKYEGKLSKMYVLFPL